jgi:hypothetical protein
MIARHERLLPGEQCQATEDRRQDEQDDHRQRQHGSVLISKLEPGAKDLPHRAPM